MQDNIVSLKKMSRRLKRKCSSQYLLLMHTAIEGLSISMLGDTSSLRSVLKSIVSGRHENMLRVLIKTVAFSLIKIGNTFNTFSTTFELLMSSLCHQPRQTNKIWLLRQFLILRIVSMSR